MELDFKALAAGLATAAVFAFAAHAHPSDEFRSLDRNGDGFLSKSEVSGIEGYEAAFNQADEDHDGRLSPAEFVKALAILDRQAVK
jgi:Ca2+-binding EF-hand superfamily protein